MDLDLMRREEKTFPPIQHPLAIDRARIWACKYATLEQVATLQNLEVLAILVYPDKTFVPISKLRSLRYLSVIHFPNVTDLSPLAVLENLETLSLSSLPSWDASGKVLKVDSLEPIARLSRLRHLELFGVRPSDKDLSVLLNLPELQSARFSKYPRVETERFYRCSGVSDDSAPREVFGAA